MLKQVAGNSSFFTLQYRGWITVSEERYERDQVVIFRAGVQILQRFQLLLHHLRVGLASTPGASPVRTATAPRLPYRPDRWRPAPGWPAGPRRPGRRSGPASETWRRPRRSTIDLRAAPLSNISARTLLALFWLISPEWSSAGGPGILGGTQQFSMLDTSCSAGQTGRP